MTDTNSLDVKERAREHSTGELTPSEYEALNHYRADWADVAATAEHRVFVLGSFAEDDVRRVNEVKEYVNQRAGDGLVAYRMDDFVQTEQQQLNALLKFKLLADDSDQIVLVCEHDRGGQVVEQVLLVESSAYRNKTHILKRRYPDEEEKEHYSWMQSNGVFEVFSRHGHVHEWRSPEAFSETVELLFDS
ncbi:hypothetical protein [Halobaculum sp. MBLA0143]|uniref:hypothetical protein n=1 Tax=Halobaculum sp. MBLA0143 TaxID=3079933 RepID=UPI0035259230